MFNVSTSSRRLVMLCGGLLCVLLCVLMCFYDFSMPVKQMLIWVPTAGRTTTAAANMSLNRSVEIVWSTNQPFSVHPPTKNLSAPLLEAVNVSADEAPDGSHSGVRSNSSIPSHFHGGSPMVWLSGVAKNRGAVPVLRKLEYLFHTTFHGSARKRVAPCYFLAHQPTRLFPIWYDLARKINADLLADDNDCFLDTVPQHKALCLLLASFDLTNGSSNMLFDRWMQRRTFCSVSLSCLLWRAGRWNQQLSLESLRKFFHLRVAQRLAVERDRGDGEVIDDFLGQWFLTPSKSRSITLRTVQKRMVDQECRVVREEALLDYVTQPVAYAMNAPKCDARKFSSHLLRGATRVKKVEYDRDKRRLWLAGSTPHVLHQLPSDQRRSNNNNKPQQEAASPFIPFSAADQLSALVRNSRTSTISSFHGHSSSFDDDNALHRLLFHPRFDGMEMLSILDAFAAMKRAQQVRNDSSFSTIREKNSAEQQKNSKSTGRSSPPLYGFTGDSMGREFFFRLVHQIRFETDHGGKRGEKGRHFEGHELHDFPEVPYIEIADHADILYEVTTTGDRIRFFHGSHTFVPCVSNPLETLSNFVKNVDPYGDRFTVDGKGHAPHKWDHHGVEEGHVLLRLAFLWRRLVCSQGPEFIPPIEEREPPRVPGCTPPRLLPLIPYEGTNSSEFFPEVPAVFLLHFFHDDVVCPKYLSTLENILRAPRQTSLRSRPTTQLFLVLPTHQRQTEPFLRNMYHLRDQTQQYSASRLSSLSRGENSPIVEALNGQKPNNNISELESPIIKYGNLHGRKVTNTRTLAGFEHFDAYHRLFFKLQRNALGRLVGASNKSSAEAFPDSPLYDELVFFDAGKLQMLEEEPYQADLAHFSCRVHSRTDVFNRKRGAFRRHFMKSSVRPDRSAMGVCLSNPQKCRYCGSTSMDKVFRRVLASGAAAVLQRQSPTTTTPQLQNRDIDAMPIPTVEAIHEKFWTEFIQHGDAINEAPFHRSVHPNSFHAGQALFDRWLGPLASGLPAEKGPYSYVATHDLHGCTGDPDLLLLNLVMQFLERRIEQRYMPQKEGG